MVDWYPVGAATALQLAHLTIHDSRNLLKNLRRKNAFLQCMLNTHCVNYDGFPKSNKTSQHDCLAELLFFCKKVEKTKQYILNIFLHISKFYFLFYKPK